MSQTVAILGASSKPDRYAFKALKLLNQHGYRLFLVNTNEEIIEGMKVFKDLEHIPESIDTLTMYVGAPISSKLKDQIIKLNPRRIIFNPGSENLVIEAELKNAGIEIVHDCTLIMLDGNRF